MRVEYQVVTDNNGAGVMVEVALVKSILTKKAYIEDAAKPVAEIAG